MRPSFDEYYLGIAQAVSLRADCTRRKAGAIIVKDHRIVGQGYNGAPPGQPGCLTASACPRGRHYPHEVIKAAGYMADNNPIITRETVCGWDGKPWPCPDSVPAYSSYDTGPGACIAVHSEANAIIRASWTDLPGSTIYMVPGGPCDGCKRMIEAAMIARVVWPGGSYYTPRTS
jgi:dCMP deaminase